MFVAIENQGHVLRQSMETILSEVCHVASVLRLHYDKTGNKTVCQEMGTSIVGEYKLIFLKTDPITIQLNAHICLIDPRNQRSPQYPSKRIGRIP